MLNEDSGPNHAVTKTWSKLLMPSSSSPSFFLSKTPCILMFLMSPSLCEVDLIEWWRKVDRNIEEVLGRSLVKEGNGFEGWKKEILEEEVGCHCRATGRRTAGPSDFVWLFGEKEEERGWEPRVDELCSPPSKMEVKWNIYGGREMIGRWRWVGKNLMANN